MMSATLDQSKYNAALASVYDALHGRGEIGDAKSLVIGEHGRLTAAIVSFTPPLGPGGRSVGAQKAGKDAITRELTNLITEASPETLLEATKKYGNQAVHFGIEKDGKPLAIEWDNVVTDESRLPALHRAYRNRRGKVPLRRQTEGKWKARIAVPSGMRGQYIASILPRVGRWKASWAWSAAQPPTSRKFPKWISQHFSGIAHKSVLQWEPDPMRPAVTFGSLQVGNLRDGYMQAKIRQAVHRRTAQMARRAKLILSGYAKNLSAGLKAKKGSHRGAESWDIEEVVE